MLTTLRSKSETTTYDVLNMAVDDAMLNPETDGVADRAIGATVKADENDAKARRERTTFMVPASFSCCAKNAMGRVCVFQNPTASTRAN